MSPTDQIYRILKWVSLDQLYSENPDAVIVNYTNFNDDDFAARINELVYSQNKQDDIGFVAKCACENLKGNSYIGIVCPRCHVMVNSNFVTSLQHKVWIGVPTGIRGFMHPIAYLTISAWLSHGSGDTSYLDDILNPKGVLPEDMMEHIPGRGFNYLIDNFDYIMDYFLNIYAKTRSKKQVPSIKILLRKYKDRIFCTKLPLLSNQLHPISKGGKSLKYTDMSSKSILDSIINFATIQLSSITTTVSMVKLNNLTYTAYKSYIAYIVEIISTKMAGKYGHFRKHMFGARFHGTFRAVIAPFSTPHRGDELHIPWVIGVSTFKTHLINILLASQKYTFVEVINKVHIAMSMYDRDVDLALQKLVREAGYKTLDKTTGKKIWIDLPGFPVLFNRNPSLATGSILLMYITKVKPCLRENPSDPDNVNIGDPTITVSPLVFSCLNADCDGDALNAECLFEIGSVADFSALHPSSHILSYVKPEVSTLIKHSKQALVMLNSYLYDK